MKPTKMISKTRESDDELRDAMEQTQIVIENRINANGLGEPTITIEGKNRLRVEIPDIEDPEEAIELMERQPSFSLF